MSAGIFLYQRVGLFVSEEFIYLHLCIFLFMWDLFPLSFCEQREVEVLLRLSCFVSIWPGCW